MNWMTAKFKGECISCTRNIDEGERILFDFEEREAYCSKCGERIKPEEIAAMKEAARPAVSKGCICTNNHQLDSEGLIFTSPACAIHGLKSRYIESTGRNQRDARTVGATHRTNRDR